MVDTETPGSTAITAGGGETTLFDTGTVTLNTFWAILYLNSSGMSGSDTITINVYCRDSGTPTSNQLIYTDSRTGAQTQAMFIPPITSTQYKVTITLTGTNRTFVWARYNH